MTQFKNAQVVMLPTNIKSGKISIGNISNKAELHEFSFIKGGIYNNHTFYHLYILTDDEIKEGDWCLNENNNVFQYIGGLLLPTDKKIIATTDTSLLTENGYNADSINWQPLPYPSQQFIEKYIEFYNKSNVDSNNYTIIDVLVEYELYQNSINYHKDIWKDFERLKVNPDNTININIKPLKESWNREEVINIINKFNRRINKPITDIPKWIKKNL